MKSKTFKLSALIAALFTSSVGLGRFNKSNLLKTALVSPGALWKS